jgi:hypothetical protein
MDSQKEGVACELTPVKITVWNPHGFHKTARPGKFQMWEPTHEKVLFYTH